MRLVVNGEPRNLDGHRLADVLATVGLEPERPGVAVAVNGEVVRRSDWAERTLEEGDRVEVVTAVQGG